MKDIKLIIHKANQTMKESSTPVNSVLIPRPSEEDVSSTTDMSRAAKGAISQVQAEEPSHDPEVEKYKQREVAVRRKSSHNIFYLFLINAYSAAFLFVLRLISLEGIFSIGLSVGLTVFVYNTTKNDMNWDGSVMNWVLLSFIIVTPMSATIAMAFRRRERALAHIARIRATFVELFAAHSVWDWRKKGNKNSGKAASSINWLEHADAALTEFLGIGDEMGLFLSLPNVTRARHRVTRSGRKEAGEVKDLAVDMYDSILVRMGRISLLCETLKEEGLPPNEATRIRQWERMVLEDLEGLRMIKWYRTPQALRSFARLFTVFLPAFYSPYYAQLAHDLNSLAAGIAFAVLTSLALTALFESICQMEDPFVANITLDGIDVHYELHVVNRRELFCMRDKVFFVSAPPMLYELSATQHEEGSLQARLFDE